MLAWSLQQTTVWHIPSFTDPVEKAKEASPGISPTFLLASCLFNMLLLRVLGKREGGGLAAHGSGPDAGTCRLVTRHSPVWYPGDQHLHAHGTPLDPIYFSHLWDYSLNTWHWKDWQLRDRSGGHPRWALIKWCQQEAKKHVSPGRFLNYLPNKGNRLFSVYLPKSPFMSSIYNFKQASWQT